MGPVSKIPVTTFEERLLTDEEREERRKEKEKDQELAAYYRSAFEDPASFFALKENADDPSLYDADICF